MNILLTSSEAVPFSKTGGLADVAASLAEALADAGHQVLLMLPDYPRLRGNSSGEDHGYVIRPLPQTTTVPVGKREIPTRLLEAQKPGSNLRVVLISCPLYFDRPGLYGVENHDFGDNCERFAYFSRAVLKTARLLDFRPDIVHANDWQTGLVPALLEAKYRSLPQFTNAAPVFTIHNLSFQGLFPGHMLPFTGLGPQYFTLRHLEYYGQLNLLKAGITFSRLITTVSPTYAREIQTPEFGCGLEAVLASRESDLIGILNGIDQQEWDPATDRHLPSHYSVETWNAPDGKPACKQKLQRECGLPTRPAVPLLGIVTRLTDQKGIDLLLEAGDKLCRQDVQVCLLGTGQSEYEQAVQQLAQRYPQKFSATIGFSEPMAHLVEAGADLFLMPSRFEPCGLNQMYSQRYGTVPLVRAVGGLADTVVDATPETIAEGTATGFAFRDYTAAELLRTISRAVEAYHDQGLWSQLVETGMRQDFSWHRRAADYLAIYELAQSRAVPV